MDMEFILNGASSGSIGQKLLANGMNVSALRPFINKDGKPCVTINGKTQLVANATLRYDEWKTFDTAVVQAAQDRLIGISDLISRGLTFSIGNGMASTVLQYEETGKMGVAQLSMDGLNRTPSDRPEYDLKYLPLPIIHSDFQINARVLAASRNGGSALDTVSGEQCGQRVAEKLENMLFSGTSSFAFGGGTIYGYLDHPQRITGTLNGHWDASATTGAQIIDDVKRMKRAAIAAKRYGPYVIYYPTEYETVLDSDYATGYPKTLRSRILEMSGIEDIKVADYLPAGQVVMVEMKPQTVRLIQGLGITPIEWQEQGGMVTQYKVMTIQVPQIRSDNDGNCGVVVYAEP